LFSGKKQGPIGGCTQDVLQCGGNMLRPGRYLHEWRLRPANELQSLRQQSEAGF
jgi:hypothetical protein